VAESDSKAKARAAYQRLDADLRDERRDWIRAAVVAVAAFAGFMLLLGLLTTTGPSKRLEGTAVGTIQQPDEQRHLVYLVVALEDGHTVRVRLQQPIPIGARVLINQRRTWFGGHRHGLIGLAPAER
jgi:hypothetical protein